ncbi:MAG: hypothetical protein WCG81_10870 [Candidatus Angelobacter sp.]
MKRGLISRQDSRYFAAYGRRIQSIFDLMREFDELEPIYEKFIHDLGKAIQGKVTDLSTKKQIKAFGASYRSIVDKTLRSRLDRHWQVQQKLFKEISHLIVPGEMRIKHLEPRGWDISLVVEEQGVFNYIQQLLGLARTGELSRFKKCANCKAWFFSRVDHQRCCALACRQKLHRSSPEFKEQRRLYMRELRRNHKDRYFTSNRQSA